MFQRAPWGVSVSLVVTLAAAAAAQSQPATQRWYELEQHGQKVGYAEVQWAPSTWEGTPSVRDTTELLRRQVRSMSGSRDLFEYAVTIELERGEDGTLWWRRVRTLEAGRTTVEEVRWTGSGYRWSTQVGDGPEQVREVAADAPAHADAESRLSAWVRGSEVRGSEVAEGAERTLRVLDLRERAVREVRLRVQGRETLEVLGEPVACWRVVEDDRRRGTRTVVWMDPSGAFAQLRTDGGERYRRVSAEDAQDMPVRPAEYSITAPAEPRLPRIFTAERLWVDCRLRGDPHRALPDLPDSPWSRIEEVLGSDRSGWVMRVVLEAYDREGEAAYPLVEREAFAEDLAATPLMEVEDARLQALAREVVGDAATLREAAYRVARHVYGSLRKASPDLPSPTALEILELGQGDCSEHCVLFVALCRAAGIPARRCQGYVCLGSTWGSHAWAEVWVGAWIGADPTTGEVGGGARYLFFGYPDRAGSDPDVVAARVTGRVRFETRALQADGVRYDLDDLGDGLRREGGRVEHVPSGVVLEGVPAEWTVRAYRGGYLVVEGPDLQASIQVSADQGATLALYGGANGTYAGAPAFLSTMRRGVRAMVHDRRRLVQLYAVGGAEEVAAFEDALRGHLSVEDE